MEFPSDLQPISRPPAHVELRANRTFLVLGSLLMMGLTLGGVYMLIADGFHLIGRAIGLTALILGPLMLLKALQEFRSPKLHLVLSPEGIEVKLFFSTQDFFLPWSEFDAVLPINNAGNKLVGLYPKDKDFGFVGASDSEVFARKTSLRDLGTWMVFMPKLFGHSQNSMIELIEGYANTVGAKKAKPPHLRFG